jgi:hypothetical protein
LSNEEKTNDYENFEKGMIYMKIWEEETKSMPHASVRGTSNDAHKQIIVCYRLTIDCCFKISA